MLKAEAYAKHKIKPIDLDDEEPECFREEYALGSAILIRSESARDIGKKDNMTTK